MAALPGTQLQEMLQSAVQSIQWTHSVFWQVCPQQGILVWGDGYYNGAIKTRKTVQPMEVSAEEASLQRSQQLRELYESLSADETNQPARRPCAALSPEDLTESEWFYLMSVSFSFPPGVGLPGKAFARQQHVWLTGANEADSKIFSRAILAKTAGVKTVVCIPLMDGVVEFGTTERVQEDIGLIQHVKTFFTDHQHHPNPAHSEHSTSNPATTSYHHHLFNSPPVIPIYSSVDPPPANANREEDEDEDDDDDDDNEEFNSEAEMGRHSHPLATQGPLQLNNSMGQGVAMAQAQAAAVAVVEPSELMQLEMSEDIRIGSPDDGSNNLDSELHTLAVSQPSRRTDVQRGAESTRLWPVLQDQLNLQPQSSEAPQMEELTQEDTHYSQTVSTILQHNAARCSETSSLNYFGYSNQSAFAKWSLRSDRLVQPPLYGSSQRLLKYILLSVPFLHNKYGDENSPKSRVGGDLVPRLRKSTSQDEFNANHVLAERRRREKLNERFIILRSLVPFVTKMDKASILGDTIEYVKQLRRLIQDLELRNRNDDDQRSDQQRTRSVDGAKASSAKDARSGGGIVQDRIGTVPGSDRRKIRIVEGNGGVKSKMVDPPPPAVANVVQVSIIERDALLELKCAYKEGLLLEIMHTLRDLRMEITVVQSSSTNGVLVAELRAKVKENSNGKKATIVEVKRAIHQIISQYQHFLSPCAT